MFCEKTGLEMRNEELLTRVVQPKLRGIHVHLVTCSSRDLDEVQIKKFLV